MVGADIIAHARGDVRDIRGSQHIVDQHKG
jgi:hypothetical protein